jgi:dephospho-CoA kinase
VLLGGGIGAGKSSIAAVFARAGYVVIEADSVGVEVLAPGTEAMRSVEREWPDVVVEGVVDRGALAQIVFRSSDALALLESITHPAITDEIQRRVGAAGSRIVVETPVPHLALSGDWVRVAVVAGEDIRIARAVARGGNPDDVARRVSSQVSKGEWAEWADIVLDNGRTWLETERAVQALIARLDA